MDLLWINDRSIFAAFGTGMHEIAVVIIVRRAEVDGTFRGRKGSIGASGEEEDRRDWLCYWGARRCIRRMRSGR
jgi:hypothetical protein